MKTPYSILLFILFISCYHKEGKGERVFSEADACSGIRDTLYIDLNCSYVDRIYPSDGFNLLVEHLKQDESLIVEIGGPESRKFNYWRDLRIESYRDTCNRIITEILLLKGITASSCYFKSLVSLKENRSMFPGFKLMQCNFATNSGRDSAFNLLTKAKHFNDKDYSQFICSDKIIYIVDPKAKIFEQFAVKIAGRIDNYVHKTQTATNIGLCATRGSLLYR
jgi:hypothetical protein